MRLGRRWAASTSPPDSRCQTMARGRFRRTSNLGDHAPVRVSRTKQVVRVVQAFLKVTDHGIVNPDDADTH